MGRKPRELNLRRSLNAQAQLTSTRRVSLFGGLVLSFPRLVGGETQPKVPQVSGLRSHP